MEITQTEIVSMTLVERRNQLATFVTQLRAQYRKSSLRLEVGAGELLATRQRAQEQLQLLVPMLRALVALAQQGDAPVERAKMIYAVYVSRMLSFLDKMVPWADGSETDYSEFLNLTIPVTMVDGAIPGSDVLSDSVIPLRELLAAKRAAFFAKQHERQTKFKASKELAAQFIASLTPAQRKMVSTYHQLCEGRPLELTLAHLVEPNHEQ